MPRIDMPLDELRAYSPDVDVPADFDDFWDATLAQSREKSWPARLAPRPSRLTTADVFDVTFAGFGGDPIKGWYLVPRGTTGRLPIVVEYNGYGGGRGLPEERLGFVSCGFAYFFMDTRGQGSAWGAGGETPDPHGTGPAVGGFVTRGIERPEDYYYRRLFTDAARAIDAVRGFDRVDPDRVTVCGGSQGGGIALAAAGLVPDLLAAMPEVPFLCDFRRAVGLTASDGYNEIASYLGTHRRAEETAFRTLSYFDGVTMASRATASALFSVGLFDEACPPSTVFAAYNRYGAEDKQIEVYPYNGHEGGQAMQWQAQIEFLSARI